MQVRYLGCVVGLHSLWQFLEHDAFQGSLGLLGVWARFYSRKVHAASGHAGEGTINNLILSLHLPLAYSNMDLHVVQEMQVVQHYLDSVSLQQSGK